MFRLKISKINNATEIELKGKYTNIQLDIYFKDICIALRNEKRFIENYNNKYCGYLEIQVEAQRRVFSEDEKALGEMKLLPLNIVSIKSEGYTFEDIQHMLDIIQKQIIKEHNLIFQYEVDFLTLYAE